MLINSEIFNEARNMNDTILHASREQYASNGDGTVATEAVDDMDDIYGPVVEKSLVSDFSHDEYQRALEAEGTRSGAITRLLNVDPIDAFINDGENLWFVPENSLLCTALSTYFGHLTGNYDLEKTGAKFIRDFHWGLDSHVNATSGFYMTTGTGYDINDEFFSGVPSTKKNTNQGVGSGIPTKRFLDYINSDIQQK